VCEHRQELVLPPVLVADRPVQERVVERHRSAARELGRHRDVLGAERPSGRADADRKRAERAAPRRERNDDERGDRHAARDFERLAVGRRRCSVGAHAGRQIEALGVPRRNDALDRITPPCAWNLGDRFGMQRGCRVRIRPGHLAPSIDACVAAQRDGADIGEKRYREPRQLTTCRHDGERAAERGARVRHELGATIGALGFGPRRAFGSKRPMLLRLPPRELREKVELDEHLDLRAQHLRHDRRKHEVDGSERVSACDAGLIAVVGRDEDDRDVRRALPAANERSRFEPVDTGHVHVEEDHGEIPLQHLAQRLLTRVDVNEVLSELVEDRLEDDVLVRSIVDDEDVCALAGDRQRTAQRRLACHADALVQLPSHAWSTPIMSSVSTGFDR
jgi:hypothetical protein